MAFEVEQRRYPSTRTTVVRPVGELSIASMSLLRTALRRAVRDDAAVIVVDLGLTSFQDSAVVTPLVEAARLGRAFGAKVIVVTAPEMVSARLASCGLTDRRRPRAPEHRPQDAPGSAVKRRAPAGRHRGSPSH